MNKNTLKKLNIELKEIEEKLDLKESILRGLAKDLNLTVEQTSYDLDVDFVLIDEKDIEVEANETIKTYINECIYFYKKWYKKSNEMENR